MSRVQLALNVADLDQAVEFYSKLFATDPAKVRPGYANFAVADPPLKLVLIEDSTRDTGSLNHLGIEVETTGEVAAAQARLAAANLATAVEDQVACCSPSRTKSGWTATVVSPGRSIPCWRTPRCQAVTSAPPIRAGRPAVPPGPILPPRDPPRPAAERRATSGGCAGRGFRG